MEEHFQIRRCNRKKKVQDGRSGNKEIIMRSMAMLTDLYQLTMAYGYWKSGKADQESVFHLFYRRNPFGGGYAVSAGLESAIEFFEDFRFEADDIAYLETIAGNDGRPIFDDGFLQYLSELRLTVDIAAIPEGTVVFPHEPLLRVTGNILECQLLETTLLNILNFQTLIATKASRVVRVAGDDPVLEFGLRRAQGPDGAMSASRAAYIGGCAATSNVLAGKRFGIPVRGTHAHSWVMSFDSEPEAFDAYAQVLPNNCVFLVDTYDTLEGVRNAIQVGRKLAQRGYQMVGIRLDSGDLTALSIEARRMLDKAGFTKAVIVASNDLDERLIESLKHQGACIGLWGVGTKLATAYDQAALGGVYKLGAIKDSQGVWQPRIKLSEQMVKTSNPGVQQVRRFINGNGQAIADMIYDESRPPTEPPAMVDFGDFGMRRSFDPHTDEGRITSEDLLVPILHAGKLVYRSPNIHELRERAKSQLKSFSKGILRFDNPQTYPVGLEAGLHELKSDLIRAEQIKTGRRGSK